MEKKGELFNQLAIITDLLENVNIESDNKMIIIELKKQQFDDVYEKVQTKLGKKKGKPGTSFNISIGTIDVVFNMSNV